MFKRRFDQNVDNLTVFHWFLLTFSGGAVNAGGFIATGKFVSHVTGFATLFGVDIVNNQFQTAFGVLSVPFFFLLGAIIAGVLIDGPIHRGERPQFDWVMGLSALCLLVVIVVGEFSHSGEFNDSLGLRETYFLLALLCLACGLQNGAITSSSGGSVRTTHLTGLTTDLGLGLARIFTFDLKAEKAKKEIRAICLRTGSIFSFVMGSAVGSLVFLNFGYKGFFLPAIISVYASWHGKRVAITSQNL